MSNSTPEELIRSIEEAIGHPFVGADVLATALTHRSYVNESLSGGFEDNERMEFLGDAVLGLCVSDLLMAFYPKDPEGVLSKYRSAIVNERSLAAAAREMDLGRFIRLGKGEELTRGREKESILANTFEAVVAAVYLAGGLDDARAFVRAHLSDDVSSAQDESFQRDFKTVLQELVQRAFKTTPTYRLVSEMGPDHEKIFESEVVIDGRVYGRGRARSKKDAEQRSAEEAYEGLRKELEPVEPSHE